MKHLETYKMMLVLLDKMDELIEKIRQLNTAVPMVNKNDWLHSADVKQKLGISESTIQRWRKNKTIPFKKIGRSYWYPSSFFDTIMPNEALK